MSKVKSTGWENLPEGMIYQQNETFSRAEVHKDDIPRKESSTGT